LKPFCIAALVGSVSLAQAPTEADSYAVDYLTPPEGAVLEVGGMDFLPDGRLALSTRRGQVWIVDNPLVNDPKHAKFSLFAEGLNEGLGLKVVDGQIHVIQRSELSRLFDTDNDGRCDRIDTLSDGWGLSGNYHEFAYGLPRDAAGNFYVSLNVSFFDKTWWLGSSTVPFRGWVLQVAPNGAVTPFATGFRSPNGINLSPDGELFVTDNQGDWEPAGPLYHVQKGKFYGHPAGLAWTSEYKDSKVTPSQHEPTAVPREAPVVWFPYKWSRSAGNMVWDTSGGKFGPYAGQMFVAELTNGMLLRVQTEKVRGAHQGTVFLHRQRIGSVNRVLQASDGTLLCGFTNRGWGGFPPSHGVGRIRYTGMLPFDIESVHVRNDGFDVKLTQEINPWWTWQPGEATAIVTQYHYDYWWQYGSPERDHTRLPVTSMQVDMQDKRILHLTVPGLEAGRCARVILSGVKSANGTPLLHEEFNTTINQLPDGPATTTPIARIVPPPIGRNPEQLGWLRLCWDDATALWKHEGWKLCNADYDVANPAAFRISDGVGALVNTEPDASLFATKMDFGDLAFHAQYTLTEGADLRLVLGDAYEVQFLDTSDGKRCGAVLGASEAADVLPELRVYKGAGQEHAIDVVYEAPRFEGGRKVKNARIVKLAVDETPLLENVELAGPSRGVATDERALAPVAFRMAKGQVALGGIRALPMNPPKDDAGWTPIFDGESLDGWYASENGTWTIEDGVITSGGKRSHLFSPRGDYKNFELRAQIKIEEGSNSGLYFRAAKGEGWPEGYEAQINASFPDPQKTGSLYGLAPLKTALMAANAWFEYRVRCEEEAEGTRIRIWVEGVLITDYLDTQRKHAGGYIALQQHHEGSVVQCAKLEIREL
jgi:glucose/arabinose dehydrogenase